MRFPKKAPSWERLIETVKSIDLGKIVPELALRPESALRQDGYLHWDELRRRPEPDGLTHEQWWAFIAVARFKDRVAIDGFEDKEGHAFWFSRLPEIDEATHRLDREDTKRALVDALGDLAFREDYKLSQLVEEAINSSVLEGAKLTTRAKARQMLREGRRPASKSEQMIRNNYVAMQRLLELRDTKLTTDLLLELHATLVEDTLDNPEAEGRFRTDADAVNVEHHETGDVWYTPPPESELASRMSALLAFANEQNTGTFIHPLVRAMILHFWVGYLHPFVDGNGRMARALFYWKMLQQGYDFAQYLSISGPIDRSPMKYYMAFAHSETDNANMTYFLLHQLTVLRQATDDLVEQIKGRAERLKNLNEALTEVDALNHRQQAVIDHLVRNPFPGVTIKGHAASHAVSNLTARKDLTQLVEHGLLRSVRAGREKQYRPGDRLVGLARE